MVLTDLPSLYSTARDNKPSHAGTTSWKAAFITPYCTARPFIRPSDAAATSCSCGLHLHYQIRPATLASLRPQFGRGIRALRRKLMSSRMSSLTGRHRLGWLAESGYRRVFLMCLPVSWPPALAASPVRRFYVRSPSARSLATNGDAPQLPKQGGLLPY